MNCCYIFGSLEVRKLPFFPQKNDIIIAADKGLLNVLKFGLVADIIVGDFDSLEYTPQGENVIRHPVMKDETDLILAVDTALQKGYRDFKIFGCIGGRLDQTCASIQTAEYIKSSGGNCEFYGENEKLFMLHENEKIKFTDKEKGIISVFSFTENATITINGLLYELENKKITNSYPLGVSNEFKGSPAFIEVKSGKVLIIQNFKNTGE